MQSVCPDVEYKVTAVNCGVCPSATNNASIVCVLDDISDTTCTLSVQTAVCEFPPGNSSHNVTAIVRGMVLVIFDLEHLNIKLKILLLFLYSSRHS